MSQLQIDQMTRATIIGALTWVAWAVAIFCTCLYTALAVTVSSLRRENANLRDALRLVKAELRALVDEGGKS